MYNVFFFSICNVEGNWLSVVKKPPNIVFKSCDFIINLLKLI
jgi:hypothetical protein